MDTLRTLWSDIVSVLLQWEYLFLLAYNVLAALLYDEFYKESSRYMLETCEMYLQYVPKQHIHDIIRCIQNDSCVSTLDLFKISLAGA